MRPTPSRTVLACGVVSVAAWGGMLAVDPIVVHPVASLLCYAVASAAWGVAVAVVRRHGDEAAGVPAILVVALGCRLLALAGTESDDVYRYLWEGRIQLHGHDPYRLAPDDPALADLAASDRWHGSVNHPGWTAIYPPLAQLWHRAVATVAPSPAGMKLSLLLVEAALAVILAGWLRRRGLPRARLIVWAWCPLAVYATALQGHHDVLGATLLVASLAAADARRAAAAAALAVAAVLAKGFALAALPALAFGPRGVRLPATAWLAGVPVAMLTAWPFVGGGAAPFASLARFGTELHFNDSIHALATAVLGPAAGRLAAAGLGLGVATVIVVAGPPDRARRAALLLATLLLVLPTVHPWYPVVLVPLLALFPWWGWLAFCATVALTWLPYLEIAETGRWTEWRVLVLPEYAPLALWLAAVGVSRARRLARRPDPGPPPP